MKAIGCRYFEEDPEVTVQILLSPLFDSKLHVTGFDGFLIQGSDGINGIIYFPIGSRIPENLSIQFMAEASQKEENL